MTMPSDDIDSNNIDWLTPDFFEDILRPHNKKWSVVSVDKKASQVGRKGDNYASTMYRIKVTLSDEDGDKITELPILLKTLPLQKDFAERLAGSRTFPTEIKMYKETIPKIVEILDKAYPEKDNTLSAKFYYSLNASPFNIILEDLSPSGYKLGNRQEGLNLPNCELVMKTIARFHAASVALVKRDSAALKEYDLHPFLRGSAGTFAEIQKRSTTGLANVVENFPQYDKRYAAVLRNKAETLSDELLKIFQNDKHVLNVLNHGDLWLNNMMFRYDDVTGEVTKVKFVDFQLSYYTSPAMDLQYFLNTSPKEEVRIHHTDYLLQTYHNELRSALELLGYEELTISFSDLIEDFENKTLYGLLAALFILPVALSDPNDAVNFSGKETQEEELKKAAINRFTNPTYVKVLNRLLPVFELKGVL